MMSVILYKLCAVILSAGIPAACSKCSDIKLNFDIREEGSTVNFTCSTNLPAKYPRWKINAGEYQVTKLPPDFVAKGFSLEYGLESSLIVCCFLKTYVNGSVVELYSNIAAIVHTRNGLKMIPQCEEENITFANHKQLLDIHFQNNINKTVNVSRCGEVTELPVMQSNGFHIVEVHNRDNITVGIENDCNGTNIYIPNLEPTELKAIPRKYAGPIRNLSNIYCDFGSVVVDYKICIYYERLTECFEDPCGNGKIYTSLCGRNTTHNETVNLEVDGVENGTIVSLYCLREDCRGHPSNLMVFNIEILYCEDIGGTSCQGSTYGANEFGGTFFTIITGPILVVLPFIIIIIVIKRRRVKKTTR